MDGQGKVGEVARVGDKVQVEVQVDDLELFETGSDEPDRGSGCGASPFINDKDVRRGG